MVLWPSQKFTAQGESRKYAATDITSALFNIPVHTNGQDQFTLCAMGYNIPLMSFHKPMT